MVQVSSWSAFIICIQKIVLLVVVCCIFQSGKSCRKFIGSQGGLRGQAYRVPGGRGVAYRVSRVPVVPASPGSPDGPGGPGGPGGQVVQVVQVVRVAWVVRVVLVIKFVNAYGLHRLNNQIIEKT